MTPRECVQGVSRYEVGGEIENSQSRNGGPSDLTCMGRRIITASYPRPLDQRTAEVHTPNYRYLVVTLICLPQGLLTMHGVESCEDRT